ncbi:MULTISPECIES: DUF3318 domain-containing protein [Microcystis]|uniref:DUF3318 domain-containing protein n=1 Tax=Microcystis aeruginosa Sj TaxID=1979544 RepID=A0A2Z6USJ3_MICAE|nr:MULTISPECIES: DUF3318 domain-containing protein [Microcystis]MBD2287767.1 DUF3318 domain-containing protein [Microcystis wesenbergii FACHB-1317]MDB9433821.1 DUF3318 domain-containing protein [Microcystis aeruginosa CS-552/01]UZO74228.1 DUF3318 domain-containing protein [Microcystis aeruginosa str. Chao 1910]GBL12467.1 hypothetical protein MSj_03984 [Microcystis aeruginosa Sj]
MNQDNEISHLLDLMPASGRMMTRIVSKPESSKVIETNFPLPWQRGVRPISINFDLWRQLSRSQRDLVLLRAVCVLTAVKWFKPDLDRVIALAGIIGLTVETLQTDAVGMAVAGGLTALAINRIWREKRSPQRELDADEAAIKVAVRRGYTETEAAKSLLSAIETITEIEGRSSLNFNELLRCQNLKKLANLSFVGVPDQVRQS